MQVSNTTPQPAYDLNNDSTRDNPSAKPTSAPQPQASGTQNPSPGTRQSANAPAQDRQKRSPTGSSSTLDPGLSQTFTIFGTNTVSPNTVDYSPQQRERRVEEYADRVKTQLANIESGSEAEKNVRFLNARPFTTPSGYFSGALLAAGFDPAEKIKVKFSSYVGIGRPQSKSGQYEHSYTAAEIAAGVLEHDTPESGGFYTFQSMRIDPADKAKVEELQSVGRKLQDRWEQDIAQPMRDPSGPLPVRSGKADAYSVQATLQSLRADSTAFEQLSPEGQQAINRTLDQAGQVIIPNVYGYSLAGHAFIPYKPYDGNYENRPNQGLMVSLDQGTVSEIRGDNDFANWAGRNRDSLLRSFNDRDRQQGLDVHWPSADKVLDNLIGGQGTFQGYNGILDKSIPSRELFNYTISRGSEYFLKYGNLTVHAGDSDDTGIASRYQAVNAKNAVWADQTKVFGSSAQQWKSAKEFWGNTFGFLPVAGNIGNIVFAIRDSQYGMTANDRIGGNVNAAISGLQLIHDLAPGVAESKFGSTSPMINLSRAQDLAWKYSPETSEFGFASKQRNFNSNFLQKLDDGRIGTPLSPTTPPKLPRLETDPLFEGGQRRSPGETAQLRETNAGQSASPLSGNGSSPQGGASSASAGGGVTPDLAQPSTSQQAFEISAVDFHDMLHTPEGSPHQEEAKYMPNRQSWTGFQQEHSKWRTGETVPVSSIPADEGKAPSHTIGPTLPEIVTNVISNDPGIGIGRGKNQPCPPFAQPRPSELQPSDQAEQPLRLNPKPDSSGSIKRPASPSEVSPSSKIAFSGKSSDSINWLGYIEHEKFGKDVYRVDMRSPQEIEEAGGFYDSTVFDGTDGSLLSTNRVLIASESEKGALRYGDTDFPIRTPQGEQGHYWLYKINAKDIPGSSLLENVQESSPGAQKNHWRPDSRPIDIANGAGEFEEVHIDNSRITPDRIKPIRPVFFTGTEERTSSSS